MTMTRGERGGEKRGKERERACQGIQIEDSWARTMGGIDCESGGMGQGGAMG